MCNLMHIKITLISIFIAFPHKVVHSTLQTVYSLLAEVNTIQNKEWEHRPRKIC